MTTNSEGHTEGLDWGRWSENSDGTLGMRGEVYPSKCPLGKNKCNDCPKFMGHRKEAPAYVGDDVRFCCAVSLAKGASDARG